MQKNKRFSVFWFDPEPTIGAEIRKIRPCVVVSPEVMNKAMQTVLIAPLTSTLKSWPFRTNVIVSGKKSSVACDQIRSIDKSRLKDYISMLSSSESRVVLQILQAIFAE
jgi:mRNA interferase MazF